MHKKRTSTKSSNPYEPYRVVEEGFMGYFSFEKYADTLDEARLLLRQRQELALFLRYVRHPRIEEHTGEGCYRPLVVTPVTP